MNKHPTTVAAYHGNLKQLAEDIGNLRYDALQELLDHLSQKMFRDATADTGRGRHRLAKSLRGTGEGLRDAMYGAAEAWKISKPYMYPPAS